MKKALSMLLIVGWLLGTAPASEATFLPQAAASEWEVALYDVGARAVVIVRPDGVETLATPQCFVANTDPDYYWIKFQHVVAVSPDYRFLAVGMDTPDQPKILVTDLQQGTCFEAIVDYGYMGMSPNSVNNVVLASSAKQAQTSINYRYDLAVFSPDGTQLAFSYASGCAEGIILIIDLVDSPGAILDKLILTDRSPTLEYWREDGIYFYGNKGCETGPIGTRLTRWDPVTQAITETEEIFTRWYGDTLPLTGETLMLGIHPEEYPGVMGMGVYNLILYGSEGSETVVWYHPTSDLKPPIWVLDGNGFLIDQTLVFRDASTLPVPDGVCTGGITLVEDWLTQGILAGTPGGWLTQHGSDIHHCQMVDGAIVSTILDVVLYSPTVLLRQSPLGATVSEAMAPMPFTETFRLSFCGTPPQAPRLGRIGRMGHITTTEPQPLYSAPNVNSTEMGTFTTFKIANGPYCAASGAIWWLLETEDQTGWALERRDDQQLLALDCPDEFSSPFRAGAQAVYDGEPPRNGARLYSMPSDMGVPLSEVTLGQMVTVLDGPVCDGERVWWLVDYQEQVGWIFELGE